MPDRPTADRSSEQIRQDFLDFFREKEHEIVPSAPLVPHDDPTLLFINAGMNPFKDVFLGEGTRPYSRVADTQKCLRVSGKHNDLEEVGVDTYHHTFFEMLGNWSFGDYFKEDAIRWAWELLVDRWGLDPDRLYATVHEGDATLGLEADEEAADLWKSETTIPHDHVLYGSSKDNFWMMGDTGPCGPCSELHIDLRPDAERADSPGAALVNQDDPRVMEIWNLVFIQYNAQSDGSLKPLAAKHVDTGMGFERIAAVLQGKSSNYDTDLFAPILQRLADLSPRVEIGGYDAIGGLPEPEAAKIRIAMRVVADHVRTLAFAIADGASPSNTGRGYVIRRILRRAVRFGYQALGFREPFLWKLVEPLKEKMGGPFPELAERQDYIERTIRAEEEGFLRTLEPGVEFFDKFATYAREIASTRKKVEADSGNAEKHAIEKLMLPSLRAIEADRSVMRVLENAYSDQESSFAVYKAATKLWHEQVPGEVAFVLHDTYGFPGDLTALMAREEGLTVDEARFSELMEEQRERARAAGSFGADHSKVGAWETVSEGEHSRFVGYDATEVEGAQIRRMRSFGEGENEVHEVVLDRTPFYAESGGQIGDTGTLTVGGETIRVTDTRKSDDGSVAHTVDRLPADPSAPVTATVTASTRRETVKHHTATHLLHAALRETLGEHVQQKGSLVAPDRLRFDFSHFERVTPEEQRRIERRVNELIQQNIEGCIETDVPIAEAKQRGAMALFGEKYGDTVRVVTFGPEVSVELCGGTHVGATGEIGLFRITSEGSVASGVRRIEAVAGEAALDWLDAQIASLDAVRGQFKSLQKPIEEAVAETLDEVKALEKEVAALKQAEAASGLDRLLDAAQDIDGVRLVTGDLGAADMDTLREAATQFRDTLGANAVAVLGAADPEGGKVYLSASVSDDLVGRGVQAGTLVGTLAKLVGGGGGGRPTLATAGGKQPENLPDALGAAADTLRAML
ncbi:MAG: alanine--tRNA ligase [Rhodothermales bacterium]